MIGQLPVDEQLDSFEELTRRNDILMEVLTQAASLELPGWYLTAGCLFQTVWNVVTGRPPADGIKDYDLFYFDAADLSWEAEDLVIQSAKKTFADIPAEVEIRNEARVHLWYEEKFGTPCTPFSSTEDAIDRFAATTCCLGVRLEPGGYWRVYAPHGLSDVFNLVVRPNPVLAPRSVYETKTSRWSGPSSLSYRGQSARRGGCDDAEGTATLVQPAGRGLRPRHCRSSRGVRPRNRRGLRPY